MQLSCSDDPQYDLFYANSHFSFGNQLPQFSYHSILTFNVRSKHALPLLFVNSL